MGSTNLNAGGEVRRRMQAREVVAHALTSSRDNSPIRTGRHRRGGSNSQSGTSGGNLALSGHTTTSKGHIIVPPTKAKIIAFEFEHVPSDHNSGTDDINIPGEKEFNETYDSVRKSSMEDHGSASAPRHSDLVSAFCRTRSAEKLQPQSPHSEDANANNNTTVPPEKKFAYSVMFGNAGRRDIDNSSFDQNRHDTALQDRTVNDRHASKIIYTGAPGANTYVQPRNEMSALGRIPRVSRQERSISPTPMAGNVTGSKSEVSSQIVALREEYAVRKRGIVGVTSHERPDDSDTHGRLDKSGEKSVSQSKLGRRRRDRPGAVQVPRTNQSSEILSKQTATGVERKSAATFNALGNNNGNNRHRKYSPYLPTYIQPFVEERPSYRSQHNSMLYQSSIASQRNRKISTDMNRYDSSTSSSSSSSSDSENVSPTRKLAHKAIKENLSRLRASQPDTPVTSDTEKRRPEGRRRRMRRTRLADSESSKDAATLRVRSPDGVPIPRGVEVPTRSRRHNVPAMLDDKYVTLPDNYKQFEYSSQGDEKPTPVTSSVTTRQHNIAPALYTSVESSSSAGGRSDAVIDDTTSSNARKQDRHETGNSHSNADELIISVGQRADIPRRDKSERSGGQARSVATSHNEHQLPSNSISEHVDLSVSSPDVNNSAKSLPPTGKEADQHSNVPGRSRRNSSTSSETKALGNIRSIFENNQAPKGDFGQSFLKKEQFSQGSNVPVVTRANTYDSFDNVVVQSQPKIKARKVSEDFWPRDEATERLLSRKGSSVSTSPSGNKEHDKISLTMQETIDQLHKFADDDTPVHKPKSRSNSNVGLADPSRSADRVRSQSADATAHADGGKSHNQRKGSHGRTGLINLSKVQMVKISPLDVSPCMSSTETLKECSSSGEFQGRNSRSHSIDSTTSNPEAIAHKSNASSIKERNIQTNREAVNGQSPSHQHHLESSELFITEGTENLGQHSPSRRRNIELLDSKYQSNSASDLTTATGKSSTQKSMLMQMQELTASLRKFKLAGPAQPLSNTSANWQKATARTDPILSVLRGNVTSLAPNLETLSEHPEPSSPQMKTKLHGKSPDTAEVTDLGQNLRYIQKSSESSDLKASEDSLDIDEGIVTEEEVIEDPQSFLKLDERLDELNKRRKRGSQTSTTKDSDASNGNESARSLSDPMANRKRSSPEEISVDSNLLGSLQTAKTATMGSFDQRSASSHSIFSSSVYGDSTNADDFTNESHSFDEELRSHQKPSKKKSFSDPNPEGLISNGFNGSSEAIQESDFQIVHSASSEPNVTEQTDQLGDLEQFRIYHSSKVMSETGLRRQERAPIEPSTFDDLSHVPQRNNRKNMSMKARLRAENEAIRSGNSMIGQLLASRDVAEYSSQHYVGKDHSVSSSTSSPGASAESSPVRKQGPETLLESEVQFLQMYDSMKCKDAEDLFEHSKNEVDHVHLRSSSEPVDMKTTVIDNLDDFERIQNSFNRGRRPGIIQAPSLDNVGNRYSPDEPEHSDMGPSPRFKKNQHSQSMDGVYSSALPSKGDNFFMHPQDKGKPDMRLHAFRNLLETEESYVSSLRILYQDYMTPLKHPENHSTCEPRLVDEMFYKIPQLYQHHENFYDNVQKCYRDWNYADVKLGDLFLNSFNKDALLETYTAYIKNYLNAREAVRTAKVKTAFRLFIERCQLDNKDKQGLGDLMIKPVQRIPRYELIIKDLLKHTPETHQDREGLLIAQREIHTLAVQMNHSEKEAEAAEKHDRLLADIEQLIEGCVDLCVPKRQFLRQDIIAELKGGNKKDRSLWLFNDLIVCTTAKKGRTGSFRRSSMNLWSLGQEKLAIDFTNKYKFLWKFPLEDVEHLKGNTGVGRMKVDQHLQVLQNDLEILTNMNKLSVEIVCNHVQLDEALKEITTYVSRQIAEKRQFQSFSPPGRIELGISTGDGVKTFLFEFPTEDTKAQFERLFANAKRSLTTQKNQWEPAFMKAIPISKTRAGMQFSCAAPNVDSSDVREVWVCNTDGYVGQVCFLNLEAEPNQTQCITVCHAKICCIGQVPAWERRLVPASMLLQEISKGPLAQPTNGRRHSSSASNPALAIMSWDDQDDSDEDNTSPVSTMDSHSSYNSPYSTNNSTHNYDNLQNADLVSLPGFPGPKMDQSGSRSREGVAWKKDSDGSTVHGSLEDLLADGEALSGAAQSVLAGKDSMWLGTEDGKIHIYPSSESIRGTKHCIRLQHSAAVHCILYHDGQVFVALSNGDLVIYFRNLTTGEWNFENQKTKSKVSTPHAITKMVVVGQKELWCGCQNLIRIIDTKDHVETDRFSVTNDNKRQIYCMAHCGHGVWVALDKRPQIKLFHAISHEQLTEIDVSSAVSKMLASSDAIIRQHKAACLRITALLVCKDLLWVGTSAGVVLTLSLPKITERTSSLPLPLMPQGLAYGHTGHVRFLTAAEMPEKEQQSLSRGGYRRSSTTANKRRMSSTSSSNNQPHTLSVIISGGDGYEDFRMNSASESAGREDSTNHLLVWRA